MGVLPLSKKEGKRKGKNGIGPRIKRSSFRLMDDDDDDARPHSNKSNAIIAIQQSPLMMPPLAKKQFFKCCNTTMFAFISSVNFVGGLLDISACKSDQNFFLDIFHSHPSNAASHSSIFWNFNPQYSHVQKVEVNFERTS